jgi:D-serine deaminase-like pyridoxal phosphate-dependent protein
VNIHEYEVGLPIEQLDTPSLLLDLDAVEHNIRVMAQFCQDAGIALRPHAKIYKATPIFAWMQIRAGAIGMTVSKLSEAEVLANGGIHDVLIANQVVGERKVRRLVNLAAYTNIITTVDSLENACELALAAEARGVRLNVLVEVNIGNDRCGVEPFDPTLQLVHAIQNMPALNFRGIMGYDGHLAFNREPEKSARSKACYELLVATRNFLEDAGVSVEIVSGGGSATYRSAAAVPGLTEMQAGTYLFNDTTYKKNGLDEFECALTMLTTVISRPKRENAQDVAILDIGRKGIELTYGFPEVKCPPGGEIFSMPQEHSRLRYSGSLAVGDKVELWVGDANGTVNLHDKLYGIRNGIVEAVWDLLGRGKVT